MGMGNRGYSLLTTCCLCHSFLFTLFSAPLWGASHGGQTSVTNASPSGTAPMEFLSLGSQDVPVHLFQSALSPWGHRSCQQPALGWALHKVTTSFRHPPAQRGALHRLQVNICSTVNPHELTQHNLPHHGLWENLCSGIQNTSCASFTDLGVCRAVLTPFFQLLLVSSSCFFPPSYICYLRCYQHH